MIIKNILILYKQSTYKYFFQNQTAKTRESKKSAAVARRFLNTHLQHYRTLSKVENFLKKEGLKYTKMLRGGTKDFSKYDLIITIGGDGTFLEGATHVTSQLMLGINSDPKWSVGRFCSADNRNFAKFIIAILQSKAKVCSLNRMKITFRKNQKSILALNDILICHKNPAAMSRYYLEFENVREEQRSSGIWVATAAGSTGATRSAGGKVLPEKSMALQFIVRELYLGKSQKLYHKKAVFKSKSGLKVVSLMEGGIIYVDGSHISYPFPFSEEISIKSSVFPLKMVVA
ncbi:MAG: NAD(+)/NADH kinase [Candidatus Omnitrophica bacterium]|nr:NAD(+)/NADH kinase [Candidatus Omnitrophota bacterium]